MSTRDIFHITRVSIEWETWEWLKVEAQRRGTSRAALIRGGLKAYRTHIEFIRTPLGARIAIDRALDDK